MRRYHTLSLTSSSTVGCGWTVLVAWGTLPIWGFAQESLSSKWCEYYCSLFAVGVLHGGAKGRWCAAWRRGVGGDARWGFGGKKLLDEILGTSSQWWSTTISGVISGSTGNHGSDLRRVCLSLSSSWVSWYQLLLLLLGHNSLEQV